MVSTGRRGRRNADTVPLRRMRETTGDEDTVSVTQPGLGVWLLVFLVVVVVAVLVGMWGLYLLRGRWSSTGPTPTFIIWTPSPAPTLSASPTRIPTEEVDDEPMPTVSPGMAVGRYVQVAGTGGSGLNLRSGPGQTAGRMDVALEGEVFVIVDGPTVAGDAEWWQIEDPDDPARRWWAVANYLEPVDRP